MHIRFRQYVPILLLFMHILILQEQLHIHQEGLSIYTVRAKSLSIIIRICINAVVDPIIILGNT